MRASSSSSSSLTCCWFSQYCPLLGVSRHPIKFINVDFPDPLGPIIATYSLRRMFRFIPRSACTCCSDPMSYVFQISTVLIMKLGGEGDTGGCARFITHAVVMLFSV